jgi:hypothetical protein
MSNEWERPRRPARARLTSAEARAAAARTAGVAGQVELSWADEPARRAEVDDGTEAGS